MIHLIAKNFQQVIDTINLISIQKILSSQKNRVLELVNNLDMEEIIPKTMKLDKNLVKPQLKFLLRKTENLHLDLKLEILKLKSKVFRPKLGLVKNLLFFLILKKKLLSKTLREI